MIAKFFQLGFFAISVCASAFNGLASAFTAPRPMRGTTIDALHMTPRYDKFSQRWEPVSPEDEEDAYGPVGSLIRAGPIPFFTRLVNGDSYEQGVLKFMASEGMNRKEAQGNMDAYLENPNDWAYQKLQEQKGAPKKDYANANTSPKQLVLSGIWACIVFWFFGTLFSGIANGTYATEGHTLYDYIIERL